MPAKSSGKSPKKPATKRPLKTGKKGEDYAAKRSFDQTPEPPPTFSGNVDPGTARPGKSFVIHQHYATRLHFDLRLEMFNGKTPVLVSWAVPKNLPRKRGVRALAVHVEDHPFDYGSFSGSIPSGNYGAGEVRIFDHGTYELLDQEPSKLTFRLKGERLQATYHLVKTGYQGKDQWLAIMSEWEGPKKEEPPDAAPMLATLVSEPFDDEAWAFEPKWDGVRAIGICEDSTKLISRNFKDITVAYPELSSINYRLVAIDAMVDGEIVAMSDGSPSFELLQHRMHLRNANEIARLSKKIPVTFVVFDLIYLDGKSLVNEAFEARRKLLEQTVVPSQTVQLSPSIPGSGVALFNAARDQNLEGIIAKKLSSKYEIGKRSRSWLKIKTVFDADVVICGWTPGEGKRAGEVGALLLGAFDEGQLRYVGAVGTGFDAGSLALLREKLSPMAQPDSPLNKEQVAAARKEVRNAKWVRPELVATVEFRQLTTAGKLRAPSFKGLRDDKAPEECSYDDLKPPEVRR